MAIQTMSDGVLREWAPLTELFDKLPAKLQTGLFQHDVRLTCVDVLPDFLALGTNLGVVYWYDRKKRDMQRLRCEDAGVPITVVKTISTVDYMVACGNVRGNVSIFQIPKSHPESVPENLRPKNKQVERYSITELHVTPVTAVEWSKNGMKLFTGDKEGRVVLTEVDFNMHLCKSTEILNEAYQVVQLSYHRKQILVVSTTYRSIVCHKTDRWTVSQVGTKDRKVLGHFGAMFCEKSLNLTTNVTVYCTRPGLRIWIADLQGNVKKTLLFKDLLNYECPEVPLINPMSSSVKKLKPQTDASFGVLLPFNENLLVTHNNDVVYILNPEKMCVIYKVSNLRSILGVATSLDEIFILEGERNLLRIAYHPEQNHDSPCAVPVVNFLPVSLSLREITCKLRTAVSSPIKNSDYFNVHVDCTSIINAEEVEESSVNDDNHSPIGQEKNESFSQDAILFKPRKSHKKSNKMHSVSGHSNSDDSSVERETNVAHPTLMDLSTVGILPDFRSPDTILSDIMHKEEMLADVLNFDKVPKLHDDNSSKVLDNREAKLLEDEMSTANETPLTGDDSLFLKSCNATGDFYIKPLWREMDKKKKSATHYEITNLKAEAPECIGIPDDWKLEEIRLDGEMNRSPEISLTEWEIV